MRYLSKKEIKELLNKYKIDWLKPEKNKYYEKDSIIYYEGKPLFVVKEEVYPTLELIIEHYNKKGELLFPYVRVDKGAVKPILNGADIMRPGIKEYSPFKKGDIVIVIDENDNVLTLGKALLDSTELEKMDKGKAIKNLKIFI
ncbi:NEQ206 [Nanoarchaeum equitans Kin4-M]|uniref:NEQ206 n=1 Tax=Nanoarchaeum equitans (strain Kin4-M) TaxID=228908 RepID=Q74ND9_NANEQ|nr:NEQ206 [Nanoarchaeum equitans Kin4-M]